MRPRPTLPRLPRRWLFRFTAVALGLAPLLLLEAGLRFAGQDDPYVDVSSFTLFSRVPSDGGPRLRITHPWAYPERQVEFSRRKTAGTLRLFVLGGSAAAGWPHPPEETFAAYLESMLGTTAGRPVEVLNAAAHGFASYRVRRIFDEVVRLDPDAILVYSGNNELLERRRYPLEQLSGLGSRLATVRWLRQRAGQRRQHLEGEELHDLAAVMWQKVKREALELRRDSQQFAAVQTHYRLSLEHMVRAAEVRDLPLLLATVPTNLRDWLPTVSWQPLTGDRLHSFEQRLRQGRQLIRRHEAAAAAALLTEALELSPGHAETWFWLGRAREAMGHDEAARDAYRQAKDLDYNPFRAHSAFNAIVRDLSARSGAVLLELEGRLEEASAGAAPGFDLFLDYVHPTVTGNRLIAAEAYRGLAAIGLATGEPPPLESGRYQEGLDYSLQLRVLGMCLMNHQYVAALARAAAVAALVRDRPPEAAGTIPAEAPEVVQEALAWLPLWLELEHRRLEDEAVEPEWASAVERRRTQFYDRWFGYGSF